MDIRKIGLGKYGTPVYVSSGTDFFRLTFFIAAAMLSFAGKLSE
jgi:hypothetical protein